MGSKPPLLFETVMVGLAPAIVVLVQLGRGDSSLGVPARSRQHKKRWKRRCRAMAAVNKIDWQRCAASGAVPPRVTRRNKVGRRRCKSSKNKPQRCDYPPIQSDPKSQRNAQNWPGRLSSFLDFLYRAELPGCAVSVKITNAKTRRRLGEKRTGDQELSCSFDSTKKKRQKNPQS